MNWQELKHALLELFESFSLPFDNRFDSNERHNLQPAPIPIQHEERNR